jgi:hypothetical protein
MKRWIAGGAAVAVVVVAALVLLLGGSGGSSLAQAAARMDGQNMRMSFVMGMHTPGQRFSFSGHGVSAADSSQQVFDGRLSTQTGAARIRFIVRRGTIWMSSPQFTKSLPAGKTWVHLTDGQIAAQTLTPSEFADFLAGADSIKTLGDTEVRGQAVTHYSGTVDIQALARRTGGRYAEQLEEALGNEHPLLPIEAWIGKDGLPVRLRLHAKASDGSFDITMDILEYGVPVHAQPPAPASVAEQSELKTG